ncbi:MULTISPECIES: TauD/TfdA family dioxygenase [unclassified Pseudofrankia]|uniref:TauD/TfdA dioxygenase family protein n=1 Tax=unclassified Pseudofrankia TaxID=2994372 RepID=UPI0008DA63F4|nr:MULTISPECIES: TauD/TfdA family dioxygenase [unclassified Pseudofrankia]MDT3439882.1 TauD/TfdA family dioxygenase [Pseudofrankia sp. BMG5.37]OHV48358.1 taurine catabolism dioxygenase TauD [Pseudofrankia sp. BMG5.36]
MATIATEKLGAFVGAEVVGIDVDRLLNDEDVPRAVMAALEENGVLLFRELHIDDAAQVAFCRRLGEPVRFKGYRIPEIMEISFDPGNPNVEYFRSNDLWHMDGALDGSAPPKASVMSGHVVTSEGGETEFASAYAAYDDLSAKEKERFAKLRVIHTFEAVQRLSYPNPTPEQLAEWNSPSRPPREHPLVWEHRSGRRSLVFGATTAHVVGMDPEESRALLDDLEHRATTPDRVLRHTWSVGDMVIWDNLGLVHRACPFDRGTPREMHRSTLLGDEPIQ